MARLPGTSTESDGEIGSAGGAETRKPRHREVFETLLHEIASGRFQPGDRLPTEAELAKTFSASRSTIARAMRDLKGRGLLSRQRGGGTHITRNDGKRIALFTPYAQSVSALGFIGNRIHAHLSEVASHRADHLRLQLIGKTESDPLEQMLEATKRADRAWRVAGVFYYPVELPKATSHYNQIVVEKLLAAGVAVVCVDRDIVSFPDRSSLPLITYDNRRGGYLLTDHIIKRGGKRIGFIGSPYVSSAASDRMRGYRDALEDNALPVDYSLIFGQNFEDLDAAFCKKLVVECKLDAIVCKMDYYAAQIGRHLVEMGLKIGRDVMLAGFDDEPFSSLLPVPLTSIHFPADPFAQVCYEQLMSQMENPATPLPGQTLIDIKLVIRESTGG